VQVTNQRADDTEETCKKRLQQFHGNIQAVRGTYEKQLMEVDGSKGKNDVFALVLAKLQGQ
jgi:adenylate kinase family enzyme